MIDNIEHHSSTTSRPSNPIASFLLSQEQAITTTIIEEEEEEEEENNAPTTTTTTSSKNRRSSSNNNNNFISCPTTKTSPQVEINVVDLSSNNDDGDGDGGSETEGATSSIWESTVIAETSDEEFEGAAVNPKITTTYTQMVREKAAAAIAAASAQRSSTPTGHRPLHAITSTDGGGGGGYKKNNNKNINNSFLDYAPSGVSCGAEEEEEGNYNNFNTSSSYATGGEEELLCRMVNQHIGDGLEGFTTCMTTAERFVVKKQRRRPTSSATTTKENRRTGNTTKGTKERGPVNHKVSSRHSPRRPNHGSSNVNSDSNKNQPDKNITKQQQQKQQTSSFYYFDDDDNHLKRNSSLHPEVASTDDSYSLTNDSSSSSSVAPISSVSSHHDHYNNNIASNSHQQPQFHHQHRTVPISPQQHHHQIQQEQQQQQQQLHHHQYHHNHNIKENGSSNEYYGDDNCPRLHWRMDPISSLSDWEIQIFNRSTKQFTTYHVHRVVLAIGPTSCGYFQHIFNNSNNNNTNTTNAEDTSNNSSSDAINGGRCGNSSNNNNNKNVTRIPLIAGACGYVPHFLDFVYDRRSMEPITRDSVVPLMVLAKLFEQTQLLEMTLQYIWDDMELYSHDTLSRYYGDAIYYQESDVLEHVLIIASQVLLSSKHAYENVLDFLELLTTNHFIAILDHIHKQQQELLLATDSEEDYCDDDENENGNDDEQQQQQICAADTTASSGRRSSMASLIADYCILHQEELTLPIFDRMTEHLLLKNLTIDDNQKQQNTTTTTSTRAGWKCSSNNNKMMDVKAAVVLMQMDLFFREESSLQKQCFHVLLDDWESLLTDLEPQTFYELLQSLSKVNKPIMTEWFYSTLLKVYNELVLARQNNSKQKRGDNANDTLSVVVDELDCVKGELEKMKTRFSSSKEEMKEQVQGWIRKHNQVQNERQAEKVRYEEERKQWELEKQILLREKEQLEYDLIQIRNREEARKGPHLADSTYSTISDASSLWDDEKEVSSLSSPPREPPPISAINTAMTTLSDFSIQKALYDIAYM